MKNKWKYFALIRSSEFPRQQLRSFGRGTNEVRIEASYRRRVFKKKIPKAAVFMEASLLLLLLAFQVAKTTYAQAPVPLGGVESSGIAISTPIETDNVANGDIICSSDNGLVPCIIAYDTSMFGVVTDNPSAAIEADEPGTRLVQTSGNVKVRVTSANGDIGEGALITSSETAGVAQLATRNGFVLGTALEDYQAANPDDIGRIVVSLNIHPSTGLAAARADLLQALRQGISAPLLEPLASLRYFLAMIIVIIAFTLGFIYFGRATRTGIEAVGRNPLAKRTIQLTLVFNIMLTTVVVLVGLGIAYLILIL